MRDVQITDQLVSSDTGVTARSSSDLALLYMYICMIVRILFWRGYEIVHTFLGCEGAALEVIMSVCLSAS